MRAAALLVLACALGGAAAHAAVESVPSVPIGKLVASGDDGLYVLNIDGTGLRRIARDGSDPVWSPDGSRIAFDEVTAGGAVVLVAHADGSGVRRVAGDA